MTRTWEGDVESIALVMQAGAPSADRANPTSEGSVAVEPRCSIRRKQTPEVGKTDIEKAHFG